MKRTFIALILSLITTVSYTQNADTVKVSLGRTSTIIFTMEDPSDLDILRHYNFQDLFNDIIKRLEEKDRLRNGLDSTRTVRGPENDSIEESNNPVAIREKHDDDDDRDSWRDRHHDDEDDENEWKDGKIRWHRTRHSFNFDFGLNNILSDGSFPDDSEQYAVRPWGSWYVGLASIQRTKLARNFFLEWGLGLNWYNFKFEDDNTIIVKNDDGVVFEQDLRDVNFIKSKLTVTYLQASLIPVIDFNDRFKRHRFWDGHKDSFRIGIGPYAGYRISSRSKIVYDDGGKERDKDRDSFHLNNFRYGVRLQVGYRSTDLFFNYDLNELFREGKGPEVNAISFGFIF